MIIINTIFSIGHSAHDINVFIKLLKKNKINKILDVRSVPFSKHTPQFNRESIKSKLKNEDIEYKFMGDVFGARQKDESLYSPEGFLDFDKVRETNKFKDAVDNIIINEINKGKSISLMCSEKNPIDCHRTILVGRAFDNKKVKVEHILTDGTTISQKEIEEKLLEYYDFPNKKQKSIYDWENSQNSQETDYINKAYKKRNKEVNYYLNSN
ncbi:MAG: DUF488 domain-containing protein [Methanobrevibacter sp.]|nr:DUF488 domain-containing protein [Candidatus Methanovirga meridionalis]